MAVSLSSSTSKITPITLQPKLKTIHGLGTVKFGYSVNSHGVSLRRRSAVVVSAITGATVKVSDLRGNEIPISDLWKDRKAVVAFARHFGCVLCRKRAAYLAEKKDVMDASGVALVLIGPGSIDQAKTFVEQTKFEGEVYADPNHASYEALKFASGVSVTFTPKAAMKIIESYMEGYRQDWKLSFMKDTVERGGWQQGGILVAGPGKDNISYIRKDKEAGDDPPVEEILKACCA
ncbi:Thioredoxin-like protein AAED1 [Hirschfeldia incana]|nr:Thioredoxin-like protein AAED1 [Hirschfeldia incana]